MKELIVGQLGKVVAYEAKIEDGKIKVSIEADLLVGVDEAAAAVPGDSVLEKMVVEIAKQAIKAI